MGLMPSRCAKAADRGRRRESELENELGRTMLRHEALIKVSAKQSKAFTLTHFHPVANAFDADVERGNTKPRLRYRGAQISGVLL